ncbi:MAG: inositol-3-phosphate synthase [Candidatus Heimdallarchaeum endolithica]|uniref:Inositol-3-phosphate synthase n=1 Tax=Candidatus Heimdallarchaeum endolithica TaxID=2876572 RepID=A0A9Y1FNX7_9ARCH|nr:MAG: inositol-3-phosphate synthase [Candidatus Heimdallarchaeum endolithica]
MTEKVRIAIAGLGNCASALIQGLEYYKNAKEEDFVPGIMHVKFGPYHIRDVEVVAAFEVNKLKIGKDISEAIWQPPNVCNKFADVPHKGVTVLPGPISDGVAPHMRESFYCYDENEIKPVDVAQVLRETKTDVLINFLPVGSEKATKIYAQAALDANVAFANGIPAFIASNEEWAAKFEEKGIPVAGDDIKSQLGATILHRMLVRLAHERGIKIDETFQLNVGGNTDFENMKKEYRLQTKRVSKTEAVTSMIPYEVPTRIGPSDYVPFLEDEKVCYLWLKGKNFGEQPITVQLKLSVQDSPNSAGVMIDVVRSLKIAKDRGIGGKLESVSSYFFKHPPKQIPDPIAHDLVEKFIRGEVSN